VIRVLVAGDAPARLTALAASLAREPGLEIVGEVRASERADAIAATEPDVLLVDARDLARLEATEPPAVIIGEETVAAEALGPHGVLARDASAGDIVAAIRAVAAGLIVRQPSARGAQSAPDLRAGIDMAEADPLSSRERDVLEHLASGASNKRIAAALGISDHTVKTHIAAIFAKLGVSSRTEAVTQGVRRGIVML